MGYISLVWDDRVLQTWHNCLYFFTKECVWLCVGLSTAFFLSFFLSHLFFVVSFLRSICCEHGMKKKDRDLWKSHSKGARDSKSSWKPNRTDDELYEVFLVLRLYVLRMRWASVVLTIQHTFICLLYRRVFLPIIRTLRCYMESGQDYCKVGSIIWIEFFFRLPLLLLLLWLLLLFSIVFFMCILMSVCLPGWLAARLPFQKNIVYRRSRSVGASRFHSFMCAVCPCYVGVRCMLATVFSPFFSFWMLLRSTLFSHSLNFLLSNIKMDLHCSFAKNGFRARIIVCADGYIYICNICVCIDTRRLYDRNESNFCYFYCVYLPNALKLQWISVGCCHVEFLQQIKCIQRMRVCVCVQCAPRSGCKIDRDEIIDFGWPL